MVKILEQILFGSGDWPNSLKRPQKHRLALGAVFVLALGVGAYAVLKGLGQVASLPAAWAAIGLTMLLGLALVLALLLQKVRAQLDAMEAENVDLRAKHHMLQVRAHFDGLTGLANRRLVADRFHFAVERAKRSRRYFGLLMVDLHNFKAINDHHGNSAGDAVLVAMAKRLVDTLRSTDTIVRLGSDDFVLIVESIKTPQELVLVSDKLLRALSGVVTLNTGTAVELKANMGLAVYPVDGADINEMMHAAGLKKTGRNALKKKRLSKKIPAAAASGHFPHEF